MRPYEAMVIFDTGADEAAVNGVLDRGLDALKAKGGNPGRVERWGRRTFAYELQHKREGYYVVIELTAEPPAVADMERVFVLADEVLRHKVMRIPDKVAGRRAEAAAASSGGGLTMANGNVVTLVGNITRDPELRFTNTGQATSSFGLAVNRRWQNRQTQEWEEATSFFDVVCWREMAENAAESLTKGSRVIVTGRLDQRSWETPEGDKRSKVEVVADEIGPSIRWATAQVTKNERRGPGEGGPTGGAPQVAEARGDRPVNPKGTDTARSPSSHGTQ